MSYKVTVRDIEKNAEIVDVVEIRNTTELYDLKCRWYKNREFHYYLVVITDDGNCIRHSFISYSLGIDTANAVIRRFERMTINEFMRQLF